MIRHPALATALAPALALGLALTPLAAWPQDRLPTVPGVLLLHSRDAGACLARGRDGRAPLDAILDDLAGSHPGLRSVAFAWSDIRDAVAFDAADPLEAQAAREARLAAWASAAPGATAHTYPDGVVLSELATCQGDRVAVPPTLGLPAARAWLMPVRGVASDAALDLPEDVAGYLAEIVPQAPQDAHLAMCVLMGGILERQPALAGELARPATEDLRARIAEAGVPGSVGVATTGALLNPGGLRLQGWDALLLADLLPAPPAGGACAALAAGVFGEGALRIGADPLAAGTECSVDGAGLRLRLGFAADRAELPPDAAARLDRAIACFATDPDAALDVVIEGYASRDGTPARNLALSHERALALRAALLDRLRRAGRAVGEVRATGFGETTAFGPAPEDNKVAIVTLSRVPEMPPDTPRDTSMDRAQAGLAPAVATAYLDRTAATCRPAGYRPVERAADLMSYLTSDYGREFMRQVQMPDMVVLLHNRTDGPTGTAPGFARDLQARAGRSGACGNSGGPHVGFLYERVGPPFEAGVPLDGPARRDYFVLPPKITWIYPVSDREGGPDLTAFAEVVRTYRITSENVPRLDRLADPTEVGLRRQWLNLVDVFRYEAPVPVSDVLNALREAGAGTGWINLTSGWD